MESDIFDEREGLAEKAAPDLGVPLGEAHSRDEVGAPGPRQGPARLLRAKQQDQRCSHVSEREKEDVARGVTGYHTTSGVRSGAWLFL